MSPGSLHFLWHTQEVIHCIFHCTLEPPWQVKFTLIMRDLLGTQQRLSAQTPQYVGLNFLVLVQPESFSFSAFFAWNLGRQVFPFGTCEGKSSDLLIFHLKQCQYCQENWTDSSPSHLWWCSSHTVAADTGVGPSSSHTCCCRCWPERRCPGHRFWSRSSRGWSGSDSSSSRLKEDPCKLSVLQLKGSVSTPCTKSKSVCFCAANRPQTTQRLQRPFLTHHVGNFLQKILLCYFKNNLSLLLRCSAT